MLDVKKAWTLAQAAEYRQALKTALTPNGGFDHLQKIGAPPAGDENGKVNPLWMAWVSAASFRVAEAELPVAGKIKKCEEVFEGMLAVTAARGFYAFKKSFLKESPVLNALIQPFLK